MASNFKKKMKKKNIIVVGGGLIGMIAALLIKTKKNSVFLIEQNKELGGLFRSRKLYKNLFFDYGSHFIKQTGIEKLDKLIFGNLDKKKWHILGNLRGANFFKNKLNDNSPFIDTSLLPKKLYESGINQIFRNKKKKIINLENQIESNFGKIFLKKIFEPIINKKSFNVKLKYLNLNVHNFFGLGKIKAFNSELSIKIKKNKFYNKIFSFHTSDEGQSTNKSLYAKKGGSGYLVNSLIKKLKSKKVEILTNCRISKITYFKKRINSIQLTNNKIINCDKLIWTLNHNILFNFLKFRTKKNLNKIFFVSLHHFVFNKEFLINSEYLQCYDPKMKTYRVTLYPNISREKSFKKKWLKRNKFFHLTVEVVSPYDENLEKLQKKILKEILIMKLITKNTNILFKKSEILGKGIPVPTIKNFIDNKSSIQKIKKKINNIIFSYDYKTSNSTGQLLHNIYTNLKNEK